MRKAIRIALVVGAGLLLGPLSVVVPPQQGRRPAVRVVTTHCMTIQITVASTAPWSVPPVTRQACFEREVGR